MDNQAVMHIRDQLDFFQAQLGNCRLCPRKCGVDRIEGERGFCGAGGELKVASHCLHTGEEPPISGNRGSGTVFFAHCNMACVYCQNYPISQLNHGNTVSAEQLTGMMLTLQSRGAHNINLVTPAHFLPRILEALTAARDRGLTVPVVYNSSGYENADTLAMLKGMIQVYLVDMRYGSRDAAARYSSAPDYPEVNKRAVETMLTQVGHLRCTDGLARRGVIIRHLLIPGLMRETESILKHMSKHFSRRVAVSLMSQYFPANKAHRFPEINRKVTAAEYGKAKSLLRRYRLERGWVQDSDWPVTPVA